MNPWVLLGISIAAELIGTSCLKLSQGFTRLGPSLGVVAGYGIAFYGMSQSIKSLPVGVTYAIWSGVGTAGAALIGWLIWQEALTAGRLLGIGLIVAGVVVLGFSGKH